MTLPAERMRPAGERPVWRGQPLWRVRQQQAGFVIAWAAGWHMASKTELVSHRREARLVKARALAVWALRSLGQPLSYPAIGEQLGGRDHTTIMNLHEKAIRLRLTDADFRRACAKLKEKFDA